MLTLILFVCVYLFVCLIPVFCLVLVFFAIFHVICEMLHCSLHILHIRRGNLTDSIAVVADGGGDDGFRTRSGFRKENALIVP